MADAKEPGLFDNPATFGLTPAPPADAPRPAPDPQMDPAKFQLAPVPVPQGIDPITKRPYQYVGNVPPNDPVGQSTGKPIADDRPPGVAVQAAGSMATDPEQKRRIIAGQLFPDLSPHEAQARVFYGPNGRMAAVGKDGQPYYVDPDRPDFSAMRTFSPANLASNIGTMAGPALPAIGGVGAGAAAGPTSLFMGPVAAGVGAAAGDVVRQQIAGKLDPGIPGPNGAPPTPQPYNWRQTAGEGTGAAIGQGVGAGFVRLLAPNPLSLSAADLARLRNNPGLLTNANRVYDQAQTQGVTLSPGQATGLPSLLSREDVVASGSAGSSGEEAARTFYAGQRNQLTQAYQDYLDSHVSPAADKTDAALQFQQGAQDTATIVRQQANAAAKPSYDAAQAGGQVMSPDLAQLSELPAMKDALKAAAVDYQNRTGKVANIDAPDFDLWNIAKRKLDDAVSAAKSDRQFSTADSLDSIRTRLLTNLDAAYPTYATARATAAPGQQLAARLESSLGHAGTGDETARAITAPVFATNNPRAIAEARNAFVSAGRDDEWNAGTRAYLQDIFDRAATSQDGLNPAMLRRQVMGDPNTRAAMQAAMTPQQFAGLENTFETIEAAARSRALNSATAGRLGGAEEFKQQAAATPETKVLRALGFAGSPSRWFQGIGPLTDKLEAAHVQKTMAGVADRLFSTEGMAYLNRTGMMAPGSQRLTSSVAEFLGQQGGGSDVVAGRTPTPGLDMRTQWNQMAPIYGGT